MLSRHSMVCGSHCGALYTALLCRYYDILYFTLYCCRLIVLLYSSSSSSSRWYRETGQGRWSVQYRYCKDGSARRYCYNIMWPFSVGFSRFHRRYLVVLSRLTSKTLYLVLCSERTITLRIIIMGFCDDPCKSYRDDHHDTRVLLWGRSYYFSGNIHARLYCCFSWLAGM